MLVALTVSGTQLDFCSIVILVAVTVPMIYDQCNYSGSTVVTGIYSIVYVQLVLPKQQYKALVTIPKDTSKHKFEHLFRP